MFVGIALFGLAESYTGLTVHAAGRPPAPAQTSRSTVPEITETALGAAVLAAEDARAPTAAELSTILEGTRSTERRLKLASIRALGRLERRDVLPYLLPFLQSEDAAVRAETAVGIAQALQGDRQLSDTGAQQVDGMLAVLLGAAEREKTPSGVATLAVSLARAPYVQATQVERVEKMLVMMLELSKQLAVPIGDATDAATVMRGALRGLEMLPRLQRTLYRPDERTTELLRGYGTGTLSPGWPGLSEALRGPAFHALVSARGVTDEVLRANLDYARDPLVRRTAMSFLAGSGSTLEASERDASIDRGLEDPEYYVRLEAVRAYVRHQAKAEGCQPLVSMLNDPSEHVVLAVIDAMGDACKDEGTALALVAEARTPPGNGSWRRESHALVALMKRSPEQAAIPLSSHARHNTWQVRMYAARAAAIANDLPTLERLAYDVHDNVREACLLPLKRLKGAEAEPYFLAALERNDYQLLRTAAREMNGLPVTRALSDALMDALVRTTAQKRDTSRDTRIAILERLREWGGERYVSRTRLLLRDFDVKVAEAAAAALTAWTGEQYPVEPQPLPRPPLPSASELKIARAQTAILVMDSGREIGIRLDPDRAPIASVRFLRLATANYFDGLTFHRVVPNFVLQGGSPGANEYMGDGPYLRDEISDRTHGRGTVGLSTRGRDTGDAQFFINLLPNPRLDFDYTVIGSISPSSLDDMDHIGEGDRIVDVKFRR